jgi:hypothetical protein
VRRRWRDPRRWAAHRRSRSTTLVRSQKWPSCALPPRAVLLSATLRFTTRAPAPVVPITLVCSLTIWCARQLNAHFCAPAFTQGSDRPTSDNLQPERHARLTRVLASPARYHTVVRTHVYYAHLSRFVACPSHSHCSPPTTCLPLKWPATDEFAAVSSANSLKSPVDSFSISLDTSITESFSRRYLPRPSAMLFVRTHTTHTHTHTHAHTNNHSRRVSAAFEIADLVVVDVGVDDEQDENE